MEVELARVTKWFEDERGRRVTRDGARPTLDAVTLGVAKGELMVVVGPSGCGKSTSLRIVAGLESADEGTVRIGGADMAGTAPQNRDVAMVFQGYALYPQMTVAENMGFPLRMRGLPEKERRARVAQAAEVLRLGGLLERRPRELSGGECQRVAMGRAIVRRPRVFLFDEPLSNLDAALRQELRVEIGQLVRTLGATAIYVTHDHVEAMTLGDRICVMNAGRVEMVGTPREVYEAPATRFVATFLGAPKMNVVPGEVRASVLTAGPFRLGASSGPEGALLVGIRPEDVTVHDGEVPGSAPFEVQLAEPLGAETHLVLRAGELELRARTPGFSPRARGQRVHVALDRSRLHRFDAVSGARRA